jgi:hypothetical protein
MHSTVEGFLAIISHVKHSIKPAQDQKVRQALKAHRLLYLQLAH